MIPLYEAMALGSTMEPRGDGWFFCDCAIGMGMAAVGIPKEKRNSRKARELWPWLGPPSTLGMAPGEIERLAICKISSKYFLCVKGLCSWEDVIDFTKRLEVTSTAFETAEGEGCKVGLNPDFVEEPIY